MLGKISQKYCMFSLGMLTLYVVNTKDKEHTMENRLLKKSLLPIINENSKILILGSLPSDKSILANEYYRNEKNQFWNILSLIFNQEKIEFKNYNEKVDFLNKYCIALWDVYHLAERKGSLDANIKNIKFNNIKELMNKYKNIKIILVNGKEAEKAFKQYLKQEHIQCDYKYVPSSSSANTQYNVIQKADLWKKAIFE